MSSPGEDGVPPALPPSSNAAPREKKSYSLTPQQLAEARHAVFFARFMSEVVDTGDSVATSLATTQPELSWGFKKVFARLDRMADELRKDHSRPKLAAAVTLYHFIVEASLAQPGQHFIEDYLAERGVLPAFYEGMQNVSRDEQRHIGFGVKLLSDLKDEDPDVPAAVAEVLREVIPWATAVFVPPDWDERYITCFGSTMVEVFQVGANSLDAKLRAAGMPPGGLAGGVPLESDLSSEDRAGRGLAFLRGNILAET